MARNEKPSDMFEGAVEVRDIRAFVPTRLFAGWATRAKNESAPGRREVVEKVRPSIVQIAARPKGSNQPFRGIGSGFVISCEGGKARIATNRHVAAHPELEYEVWTFGSEAVENTNEAGEKVIQKEWKQNGAARATVLALNTAHDAAVFEIEAVGLKPVTLANSQSVEQGDDVLTFGFGLGIPDMQFTEGKVTTTPKREDASRGGIDFYFTAITTDADIQHGNSGGAATNADGEVIGITSWGLPDASAIIRPDGKIDVIGGTTRSGVVPINSLKVFFKHSEIFGAIGSFAETSVRAQRQPERQAEIFAEAVATFKAAFDAKYGSDSARAKKKYLQALFNDAGILTCFSAILIHHSNSENPPKLDLLQTLETTFGVKIHFLKDIGTRIRGTINRPERGG